MTLAEHTGCDEGVFRRYHVGNDPVGGVDPEGLQTNKIVLTPYMKMLKEVSPKLFCSGLKNQIEMAENTNKAYENCPMKPIQYDIDPMSYKLLDWCKSEGHLK